MAVESVPRPGAPAPDPGLGEDHVDVAAPPDSLLVDAVFTAGSGPDKRAPVTLGNADHEVLAAAPGTDVCAT